MPIFVLMFIWGLLELFVMIVMADMIGALATIGLLIAGVVGGSWLIRGQQVKWLSIIQSQPRADQIEVRSLQMKDGMFRLLGGMLFILPGFISDVMAILLIVPALRGLIGQQLIKVFKMDVLASRFAYRQPGPGPGHGQGQVYEHEDVNVYASDDNERVIEGTLEDSDFRHRR